MKFGVLLPTDGPFASQDAILAVAKETERLGFSSVWAHDHISRKASALRYHFGSGALELWENEPRIIPNFFESLSTLAYVAGTTEKLILGTAVIALPFRNPVILAKQTATLDQLSKGRLILGVGQGGGMYSRDELQAIGESRLFPVDKSLVREWIEVLRILWTQPKPSYNGKNVQFSDVELFPKPFQKPTIPIFYGPYSKTGLRRVARYADGWLPLNHSLKEIVEKRKIIDEATMKIGRNPKEIRIITENHMRISESRDQAIKEAEHTITGVGQHFARVGTTAVGPTTATLSVPTHDFAKDMLGRPDDLINFVQAFQSIGVEHMILRIISFGLDDMLNQMRMFESGVMRSLI